MSTSKPTKTVFAILGFLDEYAGRRIEKDGELIEHFYVDEKDVATIFEGYLAQLVSELQLSTEIRREVKEEHTYFFSKEVTQVVDSYYLSNFLTGKNPDGTPAYTEGPGIFRKSAGVISDAIFPVGDSKARWSFLIGAYQRYGWQNSFHFANALHKVKLIGQLLRELGSPEVVIIYSPPDYIPSDFRVAFEPTAEMIDRLGLQLGGYPDG